MGIVKDIRLGWLKLTDICQPFKRYTRFSHQLRDFPLPHPAPLPDPLPRVAVLTPCRNLADDLAQYFGLVDALDYPRDRLHLIVLEGDSTDDTRQMAEAMLAERDDYAGADLLRFDTGFHPGEGRRSRAEIQRDRRGAIAACRNRLMQAALQTDADYFLFIDVDMAEIPPDALRRALEFAAPVLMANCLLQNTTAVFDLNAFRYTRPVSDRMAARYVKGDIYQPPKGYFRDYCKFADGNQVEPLHSVGGTFLLIRRDVAEAGVDFPETPYQLHIETEGFALKAAEAGFGSFVAPQIKVYHPWER
jgi:glycosyltransferase involved in cell wall biosynthesis